jgi:hypothetical protein
MDQRLLSTALGILIENKIRLIQKTRLYALEQEPLAGVWKLRWI